MAQAKKRPDMHTVSVYVANKPGVLVRCAQVFARRGYNIDSLVVSPSVDPRYSRMTITAIGDPQTLEQIIKQTAKLVDVLHCVEHTGVDSIDREYALVKVKSPSASTLQDLKKLILSHAHTHILDEGEGVVIIGQMGTTDELDSLEEELKKKFHIVEMVRSGKLVMAKGSEPT
ncbi:MAG TPA: acetolactate synthase small subunit [Candidatus Omnitrophota bacterium]|nr:acetolactate synthase small subunit [Candidatus Omnitrophota bacterium]